MYSLSAIFSLELFATSVMGLYGSVLWLLVLWIYSASPNKTRRVNQIVYIFLYLKKEPSTTNNPSYLKLLNCKTGYT